MPAFAARERLGAAVTGGYEPARETSEDPRNTKLTDSRRPSMFAECKPFLGDASFSGSRSSRSRGLCGEE